MPHGDGLRWRHATVGSRGNDVTPFLTCLIAAGGISLGFAILHFSVGALGYRPRIHILFAFAALCAGGTALFSTAMYQASSLQEFAHRLRLAVCFQLSFGLALALFLVEYAQIRRRLVPILLTAIFVSNLIAQVFPPDLSGQHLRRIRFPWGEEIAFASGPPNLTVLGDVYALALMLLIAYVTWTLWRDAKRREAVLLAVSAAPLGLGAIPLGILVDRSLLDAPYLYTFGFLSLILMMSLDLVKGAARSSLLAQELTAIENRWQSFMDNIHLLVARLDERGRINYVNPRYCEATGFSQDELIGRHFREMTGEDGQANGQSTSVPHLESRLQTKSCPPILVSWSSVAMRYNDGRPSGTLAIGADITRQAEAQAARDRAMREIQELKARLEEENIYLRQELEDCHEFSQIVGQSNPIRYVIIRVRKVAATEATVLIEGETGVGKELVARAVHDLSTRARQGFIRLNCAALPSSLVEAELFGHEKGAFTGADRLRKGRFELAHNGTLFLDEIGELPLEVQAKLLRVLENGEFERIGSSETRTANVRLIAATNRNLSQEVGAGNFREDLYYRINVYPITVPPLRERSEDIPLLVQHFVTHLSRKHRKRFREIPAGVMRKLCAYDWPGNVRELINVIERAVILSREPILHLPEPLGAGGTTESKAEQVGEELLPLEEIEKRYIRKILESTGWKIGGHGGAAEILGLKEGTLRSRLKKLGVQRQR